MVRIGGEWWEFIEIEVWVIFEEYDLLRILFF